MTLDEATAIAKIASTADGGCSVCVRNLFDQLNEAFPIFAFTVDEGNEGWIERDPEDDDRVVASGRSFTVTPKGCLNER